MNAAEAASYLYRALDPASREMRGRPGMVSVRVEAVREILRDWEEQDRTLRRLHDEGKLG